jgi:subtilase family serine protease
MKGSARRTTILAATAVAAVAAAAVAAAGSTATSVAAAPRHATTASATTGFQPATRGAPPRRSAGHPNATSPSLRAAPSSVVFGCQSAAASVRCYGPDQMRHAYGVDDLVDAGYTGAGRTIVIVDAFQSPTIRQDLADFDTVWGLPDANLRIVAPQGQVRYDPNDANQVGWAGEISLDVEWAHAIAPGADLVLALARTNNDIDIQDTLAYVANHRLGDVVSQSFGEAEACYGVNADGTRQPGARLSVEHAIYQRAVARGMTLVASAGDSGSTEPTCDGKGAMIAASTPASDPLVTGVGGTQLFADPVTGAYDHEVVWNEEARFGFRTSGGGGFSSVYGVPGFQQSLGSLPSRGVPDVSYDAAIDGGVVVAFSAGVYPRGTFFIFGGTSSGAPQWSGIVADVAQLNGRSLGDINPALYSIARSTPGAFHDIMVGQNGDYGLGGFTAGTGWDAASGLGSPVAGTLGPALAALR